MASDAGFTPGPWKTGDCDGFLIWASGYRTVDYIENEPGPEAICIANAECPGWAPRPEVQNVLSTNDLDAREDWIDECRANAKLMAAAPDLYEVVAAFALNRRSIKTDEPFGGALAKLFAMADAALAKARIEQVSA